jgi:uncharacterized RDD family membrane protein YckC
MTNPQDTPDAQPSQQSQAGAPQYGQQPYQGQQYAWQPAYPQSDHQGYPGQGYQGYPQPGYPVQGYPQQGSSAADDPTAVVGARVGQYIVDGLLAAVPLIVLWIAIIGLIGAASNYSDGGAAVGSLFMGAFGLMVLLSLAVQWLVFAWWPSTHGGQTLAMRWFKLRIISEDGGQPTLGALTLRWLLLFVDGFFGGLVGLIIMLNSARHQRLGDSVAKTLVVRVG